LSSDLTQFTIHEAYRLLKDKEISSIELTKSYLERIKKVEPQVKAFVTVTEDLALEQARQADETIAAGRVGPLTGIPLAIKDVICTK
jgi:aspartyl-tRNA(Asn)/glutamyl-tRNA(Gln) amidotransferase subunit A